MTKLAVDVWSDIMCPFCYLGDATLQRALAEFPHAEDVHVTYHSFQLMPELSNEPADMQELLAGRYSAEQIEQQHAHLTSRGEELGLVYNFDDTVAVNTRKAHELHHYAQSVGLGNILMLNLFKAHFTDGVNVADVDQLISIAQASGLDADEAREVLTSGKFTERVDADIQSARSLGIQGVPFFVFNQKYALSGAQPEEAFLQALNTAWNDSQESTVQ